jgi:protein required for attachment to host cells
MQVPHNSFVVVADGAKMLFFRNEGRCRVPEAGDRAEARAGNLQDREMKTDDRGRTFDASGGRGAAPMRRRTSTSWRRTASLRKRPSS